MTQEALKLALPLLEDCVNSYGMKYERPAFVKAIAVIKEALTQKQEPVAYQYQDKKGIWHDFDDKKHYENTVANGNWLIRPLYTHPLQRTWVGLTDVEIDYLLGSTVGENEETHISFARAIEAKLKEVNGYAEENT